MSTRKTLQTIIHAIEIAVEKIIYYISSAVIRIFSPSDDNYPATGVQPYEGNPASEKSI